MSTTAGNSRAGISLVEVVVCTMLVSVVLIGAMNCVGAVTRGRLSSSDSVTAQLLASQLLAEILAHPYQDPNQAPQFGREPSENSGDRGNWDDVDDYHLWSASPPEDRSGLTLPNLAGWQREVAVEWVDPADPTRVVGNEQGVKRVTVTVRRNQRIRAQAVSLRSDKYRGNVP
jgi:Tfp pilus assembly protein PilV